ncbi:MAG TPA: hypothetical protein VIH21_06245 [Dehalococcoidia bacterium]
MAKKSRRSRDGSEPDTTPRSTWWWVVGGVATVALFAGIAIAVFTAFGGASLSEKPVTLPQPPPLENPDPALERSAAADLLESTSFDDMTDEQLALVKSEAERVFANGEARGQNALVLADFVRRDGHTVASRQYNYVDAPGGNQVLNEVTSFYCTSEVPGFVDIFRSRKSVVKTTTEGAREVEGSRTFERTISATDWSNATDLGYDEVDGHRVHGVEVDFATVAGPTLRWQLWLDVETAQLRRYVDMSVPEAPYTFRWGTVPRIVPEPELGTPPCYAQVYTDD